jgi:hypothetical protein
VYAAVVKQGLQCVRACFFVALLYQMDATSCGYMLCTELIGAAPRCEQIPSVP